MLFRSALLFMFLLPCLAHAQEATPSYNELVQQGLSAEMAHDYKRAIGLFRAAHEISPNARTLRGIGVSEFLDGDFVNAATDLEAALVHPVKPLEESLRATVRDLLTRIASEVATYEFDISPPESSAQVDDGNARPVAGLLLRLAPGNHTLVMSAPGFVSQTLQLQAVKGARVLLSVKLVETSSAPAPAVAVTLPDVSRVFRLQTPPRPASDLYASPEAEKPRHWTRARISALALGGVGLAALATGTYFGVHAKSQWESRLDRCKRDEPCDAKGRELSTEARRSALISDVTLGIGAAGIIGGTVLYLLYGRRTTGPVRIDVATSARSLRTQFTYAF